MRRRCEVHHFSHGAARTTAAAAAAARTAAAARRSGLGRPEGLGPRPHANAAAELGVLVPRGAGRAYPPISVHGGFALLGLGQVIGGSSSVDQRALLLIGHGLGAAALMKNETVGRSVGAAGGPATKTESHRRSTRETAKNAILPGSACRLPLYRYS